MLVSTIEVYFLLYCNFTAHSDIYTVYCLLNMQHCPFVGGHQVLISCEYLSQVSLRQIQVLSLSLVLM